MKRFRAFACMLLCTLSLAACGSAETYTTYEQQKLDYAQMVAAESIIPVLGGFTNGSLVTSDYEEYTRDEVEAIFYNQYSINTQDGQVILSGMNSFAKAAAEIGRIENVGDTEARIDGKQIIVSVLIHGTTRDAEAEIIFSNDGFLNLESAALNPSYTKTELLGKAGLNTLLGMGTVFVVLILICLIISCFGVIPKLQKMAADKKAAKEKKNTSGIDNAVAQITEQEESTDVSDDLELVAVIAAAIAASEGAASTDGFVVRSIRRRNA